MLPEKYNWNDLFFEMGKEQLKSYVEYDLKVWFRPTDCHLDTDGLSEVHQVVLEFFRYVNRDTWSASAWSDVYEEAKGRGAQDFLQYYPQILKELLEECADNVGSWQLADRFPEYLQELNRMVFEAVQVDRRILAFYQKMFEGSREPFPKSEVELQILSGLAEAEDACKTGDVSFWKSVYDNTPCLGVAFERIFSLDTDEGDRYLAKTLAKFYEHDQGKLDRGAADLIRRYLSKKGDLNEENVRQTAKLLEGLPDSHKRYFLDLLKYDILTTKLPKNVIDQFEAELSLRNDGQQMSESQ
ncbi:MAG: hypothetical protein HY519_03785 [Candidatus Aenigmarchaeota archaeon]|nr:hypothetical protein [Candidatus Aenigmarchaeota archaeon]